MPETPKNVCDETVFQRLFRNHSEDLYRFLYYKFGPDNNPQDLVQEAFIKLWNRCKDITEDKARSFLFTVARNQMLNEIDKKKTALKYQQQQVSPSGSNETPQYIMEEKQFNDRLQAALDNLTEDQRVTFLLNRIEGKKHAEIAEMLGISQKAVEKRIYTALAKLRQHIKEL